VVLLLQPRTIKGSIAAGEQNTFGLRMGGDEETIGLGFGTHLFVKVSRSIYTYLYKTRPRLGGVRERMV